MFKKSITTFLLTVSMACQAGIGGSGTALVATDLAKQYEKDPSAVRKQYDGKETTVRGYTMIAATMPTGDDDTGVISVGDKDYNVSYEVTCFFNASDKAEFAKIKGDQYVTLRGIFDGEVAAYMRFCKVVKIE